MIIFILQNKQFNCILKTSPEGQ